MQLFIALRSSTSDISKHCSAYIRVSSRDPARNKVCDLAISRFIRFTACSACSVSELNTRSEITRHLCGPSILDLCPPCPLLDDSPISGSRSTSPAPECGRHGVPLCLLPAPLLRSLELLNSEWCLDSLTLSEACLIEIEHSNSNPHLGPTTVSAKSKVEGSSGTHCVHRRIDYGNLATPTPRPLEPYPRKTRSPSPSQPLPVPWCLGVLVSWCLACVTSPLDTEDGQFSAAPKVKVLKVVKEHAGEANSIPRNKVLQSPVPRTSATARGTRPA